MKTLLEKTLGLLRATPIPLATICQEADVQIRWLHRLIDGDFSDPGVNKIERLHDYLTTTIDRRQRRRAVTKRVSGGR